MSRPAEKEANGNRVNLFITTQVKVSDKERKSAKPASADDELNKLRG